MKLSIGLTALLIQVITLMVLFLSYLGLHYYCQMTIGLVWFLLIHSFLCSIINYLLSNEWWWGVIHFTFPLAIFGFLHLSIPPNFYLICFLIFNLVYWSIFKTRVPYYPSKSSLIPHLVEFFPNDRDIHFIDVGSGLGGLLINLSKLKKNSTFYGVEIAPLTWFLSYLRGLLMHSRTKFKLGNLEKINFSQFDIVFCYLSPAAMPKIWEKMQSEMKLGSILFSYEFIILEAIPDISIKLEEDGSYLYGWRR